MNANAWRLFISLPVFTILFFTMSLAQAPADTPVFIPGNTDAILLSGQPVLRVNGGGFGSTEVRLAKRDGEDALVFRANRLRTGDGTLYITKTRIVFDPDTNKKKFLTVMRTEFKDVEAVDQWAGGSGAWLLAKVQSANDKHLFQLRYPGDGQNNGNKSYARPGNLFLVKALSNFDGAMAEFNSLTESVRPRPDSDDEEKEDDISISDRYDRFKDRTTVLTSRMLLRSARRSVRLSAEYSFTGKTQKAPEKISIYLHASAANAVFREEDLEIVFLVDDKRVTPGIMRIADEEKTGSGLRQSAAIDLTSEIFQEIANAKAVEFQVGKLEYKLSAEQIAAFRKLLEYKIGE